MQSVAEQLAALSSEQAAEALALLTDTQAEALLFDWRGFLARPDQVAPEGEWDIWLALAGRGWGKTETGAQWVRERVANGAKSIALVAETSKDLEEVMAQRIIAVHPPSEAPIARYRPLRMTWPNGAVAYGYNGTEPNQLRGPEFDTAWIDELCLVAGTMVEAEFGPKPIEAIGAGEMVWTRKGLRRVNAAWMTTNNAEVWEATTRGGKSIAGTGNHPVWTRECGFIPLRSLPIGVTLCAWKNNAQNGVEKSGISTAITSATEKASSCIGSFTSRFMGLLALSLTSTMWMATRQTMPSTILSRSAAPSIYANTARAASSFGGLRSGGKTRPPMFGRSANQLKRFALAAASILKPSGCEPSIAATTASPKPSAPIIPDTTRDEIASVVLLPNRAAVFNIEVDGEPEYFANGILTHNCKYRYARETWDMLQFTMRSGVDPRVCVTTTPRPIELIKAIVAGHEGKVTISRGKTSDNRANLAKSFLERIEGRYAGTRLGRQELDAEILGDLPGALWSLSTLDLYRLKEAPAMGRIVVSVDPAVTATEDSDEHGIIVAGKADDQRGVLLEDASIRGTPFEWARRAVSLSRSWGADGIVVEVNQGGDMVASTIRSVDPNVNIIEVRASRAKHIRAEPIAALYEQGRIVHCGAFPELESQMTQFTTAGYEGDGSPDRADALVWAFTELFPDMTDSVPDYSQFNIPARSGGWLGA